MKKYFLALICGLLFPFGFAPFEAWPVTIISLSLLLHLLKHEESKGSFLTGLIYGMGLWGVGISWVYVSIHYHGNQGIISSLLITFAFVIFLSLYIGFTTYLFAIFKTKINGLNYLLIFPVIWVSVEVLRSNFLTGFPWLIIGTSLAGTPIGGWTPILGTYGSSLVVLMISGCLLLIYEKRNKLDLYPTLLILIILISSFTLNKINWTNEITKITTSIYQPNLTLQKKWSSQGIKHTMSLIGEAITNAEENEFIFFPETALILEKEELEPWLTNIEKQLNEKNISLLSGIIAKDPNEMDLIERFNRVRGFGPLKGHYDKVHLVPFGEYIPFKSYIGNILDFMGINLINTLPGKAFTTLSNGNIIISPSICYEIAFSDLVRKTAKISNLLVTISNDTWFGTSIGPEQHLEIAQSRALEHQKSLIRATNSGISAIITRNGEIAEKQGYFEDKELKAEIKIYEGRTPFSVVGNFLIYGYIIIIYMYLLYFKRTIVRKY